MTTHLRAVPDLNPDDDWLAPLADVTFDAATEARTIADIAAVVAGAEVRGDSDDRPRCWRSECFRACAYPDVCTER